ncbi:type IV pilus biogenesis protein PilP [Psychromonas sp. CNPT3]|uniref:pilus assembly protein PilP n=1 Tax=Psychromonas sp. CNPT3 TaxID=314282 RepID=UPI00006E5081|nr:pilus assembly protein PilP [Psychromonas sp. CNPT3]AGH82479.1 type IV pilus biogenesis protein PilP [Psychromonas sp. CNPT3]
MKKLLSVLVLFSLFSCSDENNEDLHEFVQNTKSLTYPIHDKIPELKNIDALIFTETLGRDPFATPYLSAAKDHGLLPSKCPQPNIQRKKGILESYPLDRLAMSGTVRINKTLFALIQASGGELYHVKKGDYLGLNQGKISDVSNKKIELVELIADNTGCWQERSTQIILPSE